MGACLRKVGRYQRAFPSRCEDRKFGFLGNWWQSPNSQTLGQRDQSTGLRGTSASGLNLRHIIARNTGGREQALCLSPLPQGLLCGRGGTGRDRDCERGWKPSSQSQRLATPDTHRSLLAWPGATHWVPSGPALWRPESGFQTLPPHFFLSSSPVFFT